MNDTETMCNVLLNYTNESYTEEELFAIYRPAINIIKDGSQILWYTLGFPLNIMAFLVWIQRKMRHSSGCYLAALALSDFSFLLLNMVYYHILTATEVIHTPVLCESASVMMYTSQYMSPLLVMAFTVEQYIAICHPMKRERYCRSSTAIKVIVCIILFCLALSSVQGYFWHIDPETRQCAVRKNVTKGDLESIWSISAYITETLVFVTVHLVNLTLNLLVIRSLRIAARKMVVMQSASKSKRRNANKTTTRMLLIVSFYWIFTSLPYSVTYQLSNRFQHGNRTLIGTEQICTDEKWQEHFTYNVILAVIEAISMSRFALNFFIYCLTGRMFRKQLWNVLTCFKKNMYQYSEATNFSTRKSKVVKRLSDGSAASYRTIQKSQSTPTSVQLEPTWPYSEGTSKEKCPTESLC